jgi:hypothetical protein
MKVQLYSEYHFVPTPMGRLREPPGSEVLGAPTPLRA